MRRLAALAFVLVACSSQPVAVSSPSAATASSKLTTPSAAATPAPAPCRLAIIEGTRGQGSGSQTPGFLNLANLTFSPDPSALDGTFYDKPLARWVPWGPPALSGDGASYAYVDGVQNSSRVHLVDVATKRDTVITEGGPWRLVGLAPDAVYLMRIEFLPPSAAYGVIVAGRGLWKLPLSGGAAEELTADSRNWTLGPGAAWGGGSTVDVAGGPNDIVRFDLETKKSTTWFAPGARANVMAIDSAGVPLIMSEAADEELWRVPMPGAGVKIWSGPTDGPRPGVPVAADGAAVWFSSDDVPPSWSIFRYTAANGVQLMANFTDHPATVAGPCA